MTYYMHFWKFLEMPDPESTWDGCSHLLHDRKFFLWDRRDIRFRRHVVNKTLWKLRLADKGAKLHTDCPFAFLLLLCVIRHSFHELKGERMCCKCAVNYKKLSTSSNLKLSELKKDRQRKNTQKRHTNHSAAPTCSHLCLISRPYVNITTLWSVPQPNMFSAAPVALTPYKLSGSPVLKVISNRFLRWI